MFGERKGILSGEYSEDRERKLELKFRLSVRATILANVIISYSDSKTGFKLLDFGAAEGRTLTVLSQQLKCGEYLGIEYSQDLVESAQNLPKNVTLKRGDVTQLPDDIELGSFDFVSALAVLEHLKMPLDAVREAYRVLRPGGLFIATCPVPFWDHISSKLGLLKEDHHETRMSRGHMRKIVKDAGLDIAGYRKFMWAPTAFLPYLRVPISPKLSLKWDRWIGSTGLFNWLFVNQILIARKIY